MDLFFEEHPDATSPLLWRKPRYTVYGQGQVWREPFDQCFWCSSLRPLSINILCWVDSLNRYPTSVPLRMLHLVYSASTCQMRSAVFLPSSQPQMLGQVILFWVLISCLLVFMPHLLFSSLSRSIPGGLSLSKRPWLQRELRNQTSVKRKSPWSDSKPHLGVCLWLRCCISERRTTPDETFHQRRRPHHRRHWLRVSYGQTGCIGCSLSDSLWWNRWPRFVDKKGQFSSFWMASPVNAKRLRHILYPSSRKPYYRVGWLRQEYDAVYVYIFIQYSLNLIWVSDFQRGESWILPCFENRQILSHGRAMVVEWQIGCRRMKARLDNSLEWNILDQSSCRKYGHSVYTRVIESHR